LIDDLSISLQPDPSDHSNDNNNNFSKHKKPHVRDEVIATGNKLVDDPSDELTKDTLKQQILHDERGGTGKVLTRRRTGEMVEQYVSPCFCTCVVDGRILAIRGNDW
jgi:hypothetical protein